MQIVATETDSVRATPGRWQEALRTAIRDAVQLCRHLSLPAAYEEPARRAEKLFPVFAPRGYVAKMRPGDPSDPLLRQVLPLAVEQESPDDFTSDPVGDSAAQLAPGLLQKYAGRALLITNGSCAIHCRYCFRRHFPFQDAGGWPDRWRAALRQLAADPSLEEIVLSGGDPLTAVDSQLENLVGELAGISHLERLRLHTRLPLVIPERVTTRLVKLLRATRLAPWMVVHANHPRELDPTVAAALARLIEAGIPVLNQAVLLRGVNDDVETMVALHRRLVQLRVLPYYLHQLDRVAGAAHFEVPVEHGRELVEQMRRRLPGYAVPRYVQECVGAAAKCHL
jgi:EF-P beta-lysylation protein EpmB